MTSLGQVLITAVAVAPLVIRELFHQVEQVEQVVSVVVEQVQMHPRVRRQLAAQQTQAAAAAVQLAKTQLGRLNQPVRVDPELSSLGT
jgi:hypothetical protein